MSSFSSRPTYTEIDLANLRSNFRAARKFIGQEIKYLAVVKANAYGHGAVECARVLAEENVDWLGVALVEEGIELRTAGISLPILCFGGFVEGQESSLIDFDITPVVFNEDQLNLLDQESRVRGVRPAIHVKIDTGMGRLGIRWDGTDSFLAKLKQSVNLQVEGLMSHLASANDIDDSDFTNSQIERFFDVAAIFEANGFRPSIMDIANSPGAIAHPRSRAQMVRLGGILYGLERDVLLSGRPKPDLSPVMSLNSAIADLKYVPQNESLGYGRTFFTKRDSRIALVPIGYNDGYRRALSNSSNVIVHGAFAPVVGIISMDWTIIDVTDVPGAAIGDRVTIIGRDGELQVTAEDLAERLDTISYEVTCGISTRVPRVYSNSN